MQLYLVKEIDELWWNMKNKEGKVGLVPKQYVQTNRPQPILPDEELDSKVSACLDKNVIR